MIIFVFISVQSLVPHFESLPHQPLSSPITNLQPFLTSSLHSLDDSITVPHGSFHLSNFEVVSRNLKVNGKNSTLVPSPRTPTSLPSPLLPGQPGRNRECHSLFVIRNSTSQLSGLCLDTSEVGSVVSVVWSSSVSVCSCWMRSNLLVSPFVVESDWSCEGSSLVFVGCSHISCCSPSLLPLASCLPSTSLQPSLPPPSVSISAHSLSLTDSSLILQTGPLFDFGESITSSPSDLGSISTTLSHSSLSNVTSSSSTHSVRKTLFDSVSQRVVGCCVRDSTNHLSGTTMNEMNLGGDVLCTNSSFVRCLADEPTRKNEIITTRVTLSPGTPQFFRNCTFSAITSSQSGAAIYADNMKSLRIESCSFLNCRSTTTGGAVSVRGDFTLSQSSFVGCSSATYGGSLYLYNSACHCIDSCVFINSSTGSFGGALYWQAFEDSILAISNSLVQNCQQISPNAGFGGGGICLSYTQFINLDRLQFRNCFSVARRGHDVYSTGEISEYLHSVSVVECDSTSKKPNVFFNSSRSFDSQLIPSTVFAARVMSLTSACINDTHVTLTLTLNMSVSGKHLVILQKGEGGSITVQNRPRLLFFTFGTEFDSKGVTSREGVSVVSVGEDGELSEPVSEFVVVGVCVAGVDVLIGEKVFAVPPVARITRTTCNLDGSNRFAVVGLGGVLVSSGAYLVGLKELDGGGFEVVFSGEGMNSETAAAVSVVGDSAKLRFGSEYEVESVRSIADPSVSIALDSSALMFTVPMPVGVIGVDVSEFEDDEKTRVTLSILSSSLPADSTLEMEIERSDGERKTLELFNDTIGIIETNAVTLFDLGGNDDGLISLEYGENYKVISVVDKQQGTPIFAAGIRFTMPSEPARIVGVKCSLLDDGENAEIVVVGREMEGGAYEVELLSGVELIAVFNGSRTAERECQPIRVSVKNSFSIPADPHSRLLSFGDVEFVDSAKTSVRMEIVGSTVPVGEVKLVVFEDSDDTSIELVCVFDSSSHGTLTAIVYSKDELQPIQLKYGRKYTVQSASSESVSSIIFSPSLSFLVPPAPVRVSGVSCSVESMESVVIEVTGSGFVSKETYTLTLRGISLDETEHNDEHVVTIAVRGSETDPTSAISERLQLSVLEDGKLRFGHNYTVEHLTNETEDGVVVSEVFFTTPHEVRLDTRHISKIRAVSGNSIGTSMVIVVEGVGLGVGERVAISLSSDESFDVWMWSETEGQSETMLFGGSVGCGWEYGKECTVRKATIGIVEIPVVQTRFRTLEKPSVLVMTVRSESSGLSVGGGESGEEEKRDCGGVEGPCWTVERAWGIASELGVGDTTLHIKSRGRLSQPIRVGSSLALIVTTGNADQARLDVSVQSLSNTNSGAAVVVSSGICKLSQLDITIQSSDFEFVLIGGKDAEIVLKSCVIGGIGESERNEESGVCGWSSGVIRVVESTTELYSVSTVGMAGGGVWMDGGSLSVSKCDFSSNGKRNSSFPSARQNIHCSGGGSLSVDEQTVGEDGSMWIDNVDCTLRRSDLLVSSPLFVPTLIPSLCRSELNSSSSSFSIVIGGEMLIPCGLRLEVWEVKKDGSEGKHDEIDLVATASSFTESEIKISVPRSSLGLLDSSLEWRGRLLFGTSGVSSEWLRIQTDAASKRAESVKENMMWWLPVGIVGGSVLIVEVMSVSEKADVEDDWSGEVNPNSGLSRTGVDVNMKETSKMGSEVAGEIGSSGEFVEVLVCSGGFSVGRAESGRTLYRELHSGGTLEWDRRKVEREIVSGLVCVSERMKGADVLTQLSSHWVLFDGNGRVCLRLRDGGDGGIEGEEGVVGEVGVRKREEGQRWMAPEMVGETLSSIRMCREGDGVRASVFSLGLVLWEIETGLVPFWEHDAVNAQRQLGMGVWPNTSKLSGSMGSLIERCLSLDGSKRPTLSEIGKELEAISMSGGSGIVVGRKVEKESVVEGRMCES
ncbi:hypothetical protein BLNAU_14258 [Blattamonas nauphoetae]|uniref:Protein kinase domain-containing protein n=1 Tax=Blattamonas nauphoetae TaxID=2049346 RepID=A0ABQ9XHD7_9EUKA|nr:hypothetical protein BLNAU_14258 [Blattamonas nauphoetae]